MTKLTDEIKHLIVTELAQFRGYAEVARIVTDETGVAVTRFQARTYDPNNLAFAGGEKWREVFEHTRSRYLTSVGSVPIANQGYRLNELQRIYDDARKRGNLVLACSTLEQAAKEVGNSLTNERNIRLNGSTNSLSETTPEERRAMVSELLKNALDAHAQKVASSVN